MCEFRRALACFPLFLAGIFLVGLPLATGDARFIPDRPGDKGAENFPKFVRVNGCEMIQKDKTLILTSATRDRSLIQTVSEHEPPFVLRVKAQSDGKNLRLYYNAGIVVFNWEATKGELRITDLLVDRTIGFKEKGFLGAGQWSDIDWEIYPDGMRVLVNGQERGRMLGNYGNVKASIGIGPAFGSSVTMESFNVVALKGKLPQ